jgi:FkbM family methyltransferase
VNLAKGNSFRTKSLPERIADSLPTGGAIGRLRRRLRPLVDLWLDQRRGGLRAELPGGEVVIVSPAFRHMTWNDEEYAAFRAAVAPGDVILEAGANVGSYTVLFGQWSGPQGRVYAFEPDPVAFAGLRRHVTLNGLGDRVNLLPVAVIDREVERVRFAVAKSSGVSRLAHADDGPHVPVLEVRGTSIDQFCREQQIQPRVIKIDVEGAELDALRGARATIAAAGRGLHLFVEMHPGRWRALGLSADDLRRECEVQGLVAERLDGSDRGLWTIEGVSVRLRPVRT